MTKTKKIDKLVNKNLKSQFKTIGERQKFVKALRQQLSTLGIGEISFSGNPDAKNNWWLEDAEDQKLAEVGFDKDMVRLVVYAGEHSKLIKKVLHTKGFEEDIEVGKIIFKNFDDNFKSPLEPEDDPEEDDPEEDEDSGNRKGKKDTETKEKEDVNLDDKEEDGNSKEDK